MSDIYYRLEAEIQDQELRSSRDIDFEDLERRLFSSASLSELTTTLSVAIAHNDQDTITKAKFYSHIFGVAYENAMAIQRSKSEVPIAVLSPDYAEV